MVGKNLYKVPLLEVKSLQQNQNTCVFISHRLADIEVAKAVANYLLNTVGVNVYFSENDTELQQAVATKNDAKIVEYIDKGIELSSHLIGIISNRTRGSWWVPYEIGAGRQKNVKISQLLLDEVEELPSYLKIAEKLLPNIDSLRNWVNSDIKGERLWERKSYTQSELPAIPRVTRYNVKNLRFV